MTDFCISAPNLQTMAEAFNALGLLSEGGNIRTQGLIEETEWVMLDVGQIGPSYWVVMRWNGDAPLPSIPPGIVLSWRSDDENAGEYPVDLPRFA